MCARAKTGICCYGGCLYVTVMIEFTLVSQIRSQMRLETGSLEVLLSWSSTPPAFVVNLDMHRGRYRSVVVQWKEVSDRCSFYSVHLNAHGGVNRRGRGLSLEVGDHSAWRQVQLVIANVHVVFYNSSKI